MTEPLSQTSAARAPHWGLWATIGWSLAIAAVFVSLQFAVLIGLTIAGYDVDPASGTLLAYASLATGLVCPALIVGIVKLKKGSSVRDYLRFNPVSGRTLFRWIAVTVALIALADLVIVSMGRPLVPEFMRQAYATADSIALFWIALVIAAPIFEEMFFRGFLFTGLESSALGAAGAVLVTAAVWAAIHLQYDTFDMGLILCLGVVLGVARLATRSLFVTVAMHATMNFVATVETMLLVTR
jgi:membrane protease YdiL (CAAX protease family)